MRRYAVFKQLLLLIEAWQDCLLVAHYNSRQYQSLNLRHHSPLSEVIRDIELY